MGQLIALSPTKASTWLDCRYRFRRQYVDRVRVPQRWAHQSLGLSIHAVLRDWFDLEPAQRTQEAVRSLMRRSWIPVGYRTPEQSEQWEQQAASMTWSYLQDEVGRTEPHSRERSLGARTEAITITGRIDRLDVDENDPEQRRLTVVDYKTGRSVPTTDDVRSSMALAAYAVCVRQSLRRPADRVQLHHVPSGTRVEWQHTEAGLQRHLDRLDRIGLEFAAAQRVVDAGDASVQEVFTPSPGPLCGWCDHQESCAVGLQAAAPKQTWAGLPSD